jgi:hypothetical protein
MTTKTTPTADDPTTEAQDRPARHLTDRLRHPAVCTVAVLVLAPVLFFLGRDIGATVYTATDGQPLPLIIVVLSLLAIVAAVAAIGAWVDRRRSRDGNRRVGTIIREEEG